MTGSTRHRRRFQAGLAAVAVGASLLVTQIALRADAGTPAGDVEPGEVGAAAAVMGAVPQASSLSLTVSAGQSDAAYNQTEDQATSGSVDLGGLGVLLENSPVCGSVLLTQQRQPPVISADSASGSGTQTNDSDGHETVTVSAQPEYAEAVTAPVSQAIPGVLSVAGQSETVVRYVSGQEQEATASVEADISLAGGLVTMEGARWSASIETGVTSSSHASFDPGTVTLSPAGLPVTLPSADSEGQVIAAVNTVLSTVGVTVIPPSETTDSYTGSLSMTPLDVHFTGSPTDNKVLSPIAPGIGQLEAVVDGQTSDGSDCSQVQNLLGNMLTPSEEVANLLLAGAQGSGGLDLDLGGATVSAQAAPDYADPFDVAGAPPAPSLPVTSSAAPAAGGTSGGTAASSPVATSPEAISPVGTTGAAGGPPVAGATAAGPTQRTAPSSPSLIRCVSTSPARSPGCWSGLGVVAGAVAVGVGAVLLAADLVPSLAGGILPAGLVPAGLGRRSRRSAKRHDPKRRMRR